MFAAEMSALQYREDSDFDVAFKNLLQPIESITKKDPCEILQYDLIKVIINTAKKIITCYIICYECFISGTGFVFKSLEKISKR